MGKQRIIYNFNPYIIIKGIMDCTEGLLFLSPAKCVYDAPTKETKKQKKKTAAPQPDTCIAELVFYTNISSPDVQNRILFL